MSYRNFWGVFQICEVKSDADLQKILVEAPVMDSIGWPTGKQYKVRLFYLNLLEALFIMFND